MSVSKEEAKALEALGDWARKPTDLDKTNNVAILEEGRVGFTRAETDQYNNRLAFAEAVKATYNEAQDLLLHKHQAYGPKNIVRTPGGALNGLLVRMGDKLARMENLLANPVADEATADEALRDTMLDLANYALISVLVLDGQWPDA